MPIRSPLFTVMEAAVRKAGRGLVRDFHEVDKLHVSTKGPMNFVTAADLRAEKILREELGRARPNFGFLCEESGETEGKDRHHRWIIDPLDGTTNFLHAIPYFCISVALEARIGDTPEILAGLVYDPLRDEVFYAEKGKGAFVGERKLKVSARKEIADALVAGCAPRAHQPAQQESAWLHAAISKLPTCLRCTGASALDLAYVAAGRIDGFWHTGLKPWDIAAGALLIEESGGSLRGFAPDEPHPFKAVHCENVIAGNPGLLASLGEILNKRPRAA